jgi:hypothetical protein
MDGKKNTFGPFDLARTPFADSAASSAPPAPLVVPGLQSTPAFDHAVPDGSRRGEVTGRNEMKRGMILAVAAVLAVAAAGPAFADPGSGGRGRNRGSETQPGNRNQNDDGDWKDKDWEDGDWEDGDGRYDQDSGRRGDRSRTPRIDRWENRLEMKIRQGIRSGALNRREAMRLRNQLAQIHRQEAHFKADGRLSPRERQILVRSTARLNDRIESELMDGQNRGSRYGRRHG